MDADLADQVWDAVMWLHTVDVHTTMSAIAEAGLRADLQRLAEAHKAAGTTLQMVPIS